VWTVVYEKTNKKYYPEGFALNFGEWETVLSKNKYAADCHGHCHVFLSLDCAKELASKEKCSGLLGRYAEPENYCLANVSELEVKRLLAAESKILKSRLDTLCDTVNNLNTFLREKLK
jgi:hypothetical protein